MPVKPLDLQVNINSLIEVARSEGDKHTREIDRQKQIDQNNVRDAVKKEQRVHEKGEAAEMGKLDDTEKHFGTRSVKEDEVDYLMRNRKKKHNSSEKEQKNEESNENKTDEEDGHFNFIA